MTDNLFIVDRENVFWKVMYEYYRIINIDLVKQIKQNLQQMVADNKDGEIYKKKAYTYFLMKEFIQNYNLEIL